MGGDDLGSDDEFLGGGVVDDNHDDDLDYLSTTARKDSVLKTSTVAAVVDDDNDNAKKNKRNRKDDAEQQEASTIKPPKKKSRRKVLMETARCIEEESAERQAAFTWTNLLHHHHLKSGKEGESDDALLDETPLALQPKLQPHHFKTCNKNSQTMEARLRDVIPSMKHIKSWKHTKSPMILIVCVSARRAVQVLKEIQPFKTRAAKLFAKHMQVSQQEEMLRQTAFGIAVGTPHRLQVLCDKNALQLTHTKLIVLDAHKDAKNFTVCTLPDTAPHCMEFLKDQVLSQLKERPKECKLAFC